MEFERLRILIGDKVEKLKKLNILVIGVGGVGGYAVESLVRLGISNITIVDYDKVDITNINRQIIALHSTIGKKKVDVLESRILDINPNCIVKKLDIFCDDTNYNLLFDEKYDYVLDCCDSIKTKELLIRECIKNNIKIISSMGAGFKLNPSKVKIAKLKDTDYDKLAKKLRYNLRDSKECLNIPVIYSNEEVKLTGTTIGSNSYMPSIFGLYITSYVLNDFLGGYHEI